MIFDRWIDFCFLHPCMLLCLFLSLPSPDEWNVAVVVCGTRTDTGGTGGRQVSEVDGKNWAEKHNFSHVLTSAALGNGITQAFHVSPGLSRDI